MGKIGIFPASGSLGSSIYRHLLNIVDAPNVILVSRHPEKIPLKYTEAGITARKADYDAPETLDDAFNDVSNLVLISKTTIEIGQRVQAHKHVIDAAIRSGVSQIFYTSFALDGDGSSISAAYVMQAHLETEAYLKSLAASYKKNFSFTVIREGFYSESFPLYTGFPDLQNPESKFRIPHNGSGPGIAWAKMDDLGEATANLVWKYHESGAAGLSEYKNQVIMLTGLRAYSLAETANVLGAVLGKKIEIECVDVEDYVKDPVVQKHLSPYGQGDVPRKWVTSFEAVRKGEAAVTSVRLGELLGRKPESFEVTITAMIKRLHEM